MMTSRMLDIMRELRIKSAEEEAERIANRSLVMATRTTPRWDNALYDNAVGPERDLYNNWISAMRSLQRVVNESYTTYESIQRAFQTMIKTENKPESDVSLMDCLLEEGD